MNKLRLIAWVLLAGFTVVEPAWSQAELPQVSQDQVSQDSADQSSDLLQPQAGELQVDPAAPLQVTEQDRDRFFTPAPRPSTIESDSGKAAESDRLIQPPPGSQTPGQLTPTRRLSFPIP